MFRKTLVVSALALMVAGAAPALAQSALTSRNAGPAYQGGPKSTGSVSQASQTFETHKPYAQVVPAARSGNRHIYYGGPKSTILHGEH